MRHGNERLLQERLAREESQWLHEMQQDKMAILHGGIARLIIMAKIIQALTRASQRIRSHNVVILSSGSRQPFINKLNTSFQQELRQEVDAQSFFIE